MAISDGDGLPLAVHVASASPHETKLVEATLEQRFFADLPERLIGGNSFVDQAAITGESLPVEKVPGASVFAGTVNQSGGLEIRVTRIGRDTAFGRILNAVEEA